jgi:hypothetical protein
LADLVAARFRRAETRCGPRKVLRGGENLFDASCATSTDARDANASNARATPEARGIP